MSTFQRLAALLLFAQLLVAAPAGKDCTGTISSLDDVDDAVECTTVNINAFTVPAGETFNLDLADGTTVTMNGDVTFGTKNWDGPLFEVRDSITFNGNGHTFNGRWPRHQWRLTKPDPMMKIKISGTFTNVKVLNSPARVYSVSNPRHSSCPNSPSITHNSNQDDCLAINKGTNIVFQQTAAQEATGSISSDAIVSGIVVANNVVTTKSARSSDPHQDQGFSNRCLRLQFTYSGNTATGLRQFGVLIDQSYPDTLGTPGTGVTISDINFVGSTNSFTVNSGADRVAVNCGAGACTGTWDWSALEVSGGVAGPITNFNGIENFSQ
ncbi:hypothetical protein A0H81_03399 [Grifola frondosa]|uniref:Uncharacterized protein n=1 Tax=Grifola frondosa TaxID=5627 RepID=A0A1C7MH35_GRIFR|nr:hypothetical protein A0H81_03399 [Grifola frondosa]